MTVDEFRIAVAETYDVIVEPSGQDAFTIFAQAMDRTGYAAGTLAVRDGLRAPVPALDPRAVLTMADMGHGGMDRTATPCRARHADAHAADARGMPRRMARMADGAAHPPARRATRSSTCRR